MYLSSLSLPISIPSFPMSNLLSHTPVTLSYVPSLSSSPVCLPSPPPPMSLPSSPLPRSISFQLSYVSPLLFSYVTPLSFSPVSLPSPPLLCPFHLLSYVPPQSYSSYVPSFSPSSYVHLISTFLCLSSPPLPCPSPLLLSYDPQFSSSSYVPPLSSLPSLPSSSVAGRVQ